MTNVAGLLIEVKAHIIPWSPITTTIELENLLDPEADPTRDPVVNDPDLNSGDLDPILDPTVASKDVDRNPEVKNEEDGLILLLLISFL
eukprot:CAMPEP_0175053940 /NCGR_PEP_ID=MMETSP0052_2-20121109/9214_1 /TAXON_ID=51329 ORGANISM="Polytomella parva, Strain SAG 63-3" /NCGR_SAMPLE_ID=MMETSP0052_2 /ASSEMBLY_ACC=CAM_ASM_000194 /LENGTH=88 /DNA_ID=CAMNT_0016318551 /DNA_START=331 /DNA_END=598 /DNA_ORIENTATION=-